MIDRMIRMQLVKRCSHEKDKRKKMICLTDYAKGLKAGDIIKAIAPAIQGGGGGRPDMAQAGGKNPAGIPQAFELLKEYLAK